MHTKLDYKTLASDVQSKNTNKNQLAEMIIVLFFGFLVVGVMAQVPRPAEDRPEPQISAISSKTK